MVVIPLRYRIPNVQTERMGALNDVVERPPLMCFVGDVPRVREAVFAWQGVGLSVEQRRSEVVCIVLDEAIDAPAFCAYVIDIFRQISLDSAQGYKLEHQGSVEDMLTHMIDFADLHHLKVIIENAHLVDAHALGVFASCVQRYACSATWLLLGDMSLVDVVDTACVTHVGDAPLRDTSLRDAAMQDPLQMSVSPSGSYKTKVMPLLEPSVAQLKVISVLNATHYAVVSSCVFKACEVSEVELTQLQDAGVVQVSPAGLVLSPDQGEALQCEHGVEIQHVHTLLDVMIRAEGEEQVDVWFAALKCAVYHRLLPRIEEVLELHFEHFRRVGYLVDLYVILDGLKEPRLQVWLFRASCYMADFEKAEALRWQEDLELEDSMYWLYLLLMKGKFEALQKQGNVLLEQHERPDMGSKEKMFCDQIRILLSRSYIQTAEFQKALDTLEPTSTEDKWMNLRTRIVRMKALAYSGRVLDGRALLRDIMEVFESLPYAEQSYWAIVVVQNYYILKQYREAARVARRFFGMSNAIGNLRGTAPIMLGALWTDTGDEELADRCIQLARYSFQSATSMFAMVCNIDLANAISRGHVEHIAECVEQFKGLRAQNISVQSKAEHYIMRIMAWAHYGRRLDAIHKPQIEHYMAEWDGIPMVKSAQQMWTYLHEPQVDNPSPDIPVELIAGEEENYLFEMMAQATGRAIQGVECTDELSAAIATARHFAMYRVGQEICQLYCIHSFLFVPSKFEQAIEFLDEFVSVTGSKRFAEELILWRLLRSKKSLEIQGLEDLFERVQHAALAYTMCATMLGDVHVDDLNALEQMLYSRMSEVLEEQSVVVLPGLQESSTPSVEASSPLWSIHMNTGQVWLLTDEVSQEVLLDTESIPFHLLKHLLKNPGEVDKEELITRTWDDVSEYHPLMHDNRLRLAIRKLRKQLRDELGDLPFIATTRNGYSIGCPVRMIERK